MIGQTVSHYKILEELGAGGMGVVYKAEDTKLKRTVALKFLPPELTRDKDAKKRFIHEAQAASALQHNNICAIHEIDETKDGRVFISMDCYEGETLKEKLASGPLGIEETIDIASQVATGLSEAHAAGMVHRDVKPANIIVTDKGVVKILDFGLAKLAGMTKVTKTGMTVGTVSYMSPEQAKGEEIDSRSDVWSLGVMIYEMLTGRLPFRGDMEPAIVYSILNEDPETMTATRREVPVSLGEVVERALSKDVTKRFGTMEEILSELERIKQELQLGITRRGSGTITRLRRRKWFLGMTAAVAVLVSVVVFIRVFQSMSTTIDSIAVLPLENLMGDPDQEYFVDGMTEQLITELSKVGALRVISRTSVMRYKETEKSLPQIADELNVDAIVEGSVLRAGDRVRITAQLIGTDPERHLWADNYDRDLGDILILSSEVARAIARQVKVTLTPQEQTQLTSARTVNAEAYEYYLKGLYQYEKWTKDGFEKAIEYFQMAIAADPNHARSYDGLADCYLWLGFLGVLSVEEALSKARPPLRKALEIDDKLAEAHETLAGIKHYYDWDWVGAEAGYRRAIELDPNFIEARLEHAYFLSGMGRFAEAINDLEYARRIDPLSLPVNRTLGDVYYQARKYDQAIAQYKQVTELNENDPTAYYGLARVYEQMGRYEDAVIARQKMMTVMGADSEDVNTLGRAFGDSGPSGYWMWLLEKLKGRYENNPLKAAKYYAQLGNKDEAFAWLEKAYEKRDPKLFPLKVIPYWDPLRDDPRFQDLLRRMNFPEIEAQE